MKEKINNLQLLRAIAALNVVYFHIISTSESYGMPLVFLSFMEGLGASGVDIFFVISGFIMVFTQSKKKLKPGPFLINRVSRIIPTYWVITIFLILLLILHPSLAKNMSYSNLWAIHSLMLISDILYEKHPMIYVGWTIEYEMLFYLIFSFSLFFKSIKQSIVFTGLTLIAVTIFFNLNIIMVEFILGMILGGIYVEDIYTKYLIRFSNLNFLLGFVGFVLSFFFISENMNRLLLWGLPSTMIVLSLLYSRQINTSIMTKLGDASYSIYLIQVLTIPLFYKLVSFVNLKIQHDFLSLICLLFSAYVGLIFYEKVEIVMSRKLNVFLRKTPL